MTDEALIAESPTETHRAPSKQSLHPLVSVYNEWDPLEEVLVGSAIGARVPRSDKGLFTIRYSKYEFDAIPIGPRSARIIEETEEDLDAIVQALVQEGVTVRRPAPTDHSAVIRTPDWETDGMYNYCPRDIMLAVGNTIIETPMSMRSRFLEPAAYKDLLIEYMESGVRWISAPKPRLADDIYNTTDPDHFALLNHEPVFDAANCLRIGRDILYQVSDTGNYMGAVWLQGAVGPEYRVHAYDNLYDEAHIDTTITPLRPGLVLINPSRINEANLPSIFKKWDVIVAPEPVDMGYTDVAFGSAWIFSMNMLMINPRLAMVDKNQKVLISLLRKQNIDCIPLRLRHARTLSGGFHCVTLDVRRRGALEYYC